MGSDGSDADAVSVALLPWKALPTTTLMVRVWDLRGARESAGSTRDQGLSPAATRPAGDLSTVSPTGSCTPTEAPWIQLEPWFKILTLIRNSSAGATRAGALTLTLTGRQLLLAAAAPHDNDAAPTRLTAKVISTPSSRPAVGDGAILRGLESVLCVRVPTAGEAGAETRISVGVKSSENLNLTEQRPSSFAHTLRTIEGFEIQGRDAELAGHSDRRIDRRVDKQFSRYTKPRGAWVLLLRNRWGVLRSKLNMLETVLTG